MLPCLNAAELFILSHTEQDMMTHYSCDLLFFSAYLSNKAQVFLLHK